MRHIQTGVLLSAEEEGRGLWVTYQCSILSDQRLDHVPAGLKDEGGIDEQNLSKSLGIVIEENINLCIITCWQIKVVRLLTRNEEMFWQCVACAQIQIQYSEEGFIITHQKLNKFEVSILLLEASEIKNAEKCFTTRRQLAERFLDQIHAQLLAVQQFLILPTMERKAKTKSQGDWQWWIFNLLPKVPKIPTQCCFMV